MGLLDGIADGVEVKWLQRPNVNHLRVIPFVDQRLGSLHDVVAHARVGEDRDMLTGPHHLGLLQAEDVLLVWDPLLEIVEQDVLEEHDGVVAAYGGLHEALGIVRCRACHHLEARDGLEVGLKALRVLGTKLPTDAAGASDDDGDLELAAGGVVEHAAVVGDLVVGQEEEAHVHALHDGPEPGHGSTDAHAREGILCNWCVEDPQIAIFGGQALGHLVGATVVAHVLPHHAYRGVPVHLLLQALPERLKQEELVPDVQPAAELFLNSPQI